LERSKPLLQRPVAWPRLLSRTFKFGEIWHLIRVVQVSGSGSAAGFGGHGVGGPGWLPCSSSHAGRGGGGGGGGLSRGSSHSSSSCRPGGILCCRCRCKIFSRDAMLGSHLRFIGIAQMRCFHLVCTGLLSFYRAFVALVVFARLESHVICRDPRGGFTLGLGQRSVIARSIQRTSHPANQRT
jgi:hypothetical protein